jgi:hypothetical protein
MKPLKPRFLLAACLSLLPLSIPAQADAPKASLPKLENPISVNYLRVNLAKNSPRLMLTPAIERDLKTRLATDPLIQAYHRHLQAETAAILELPLPTREMRGFRLLHVSRDVLRRLGTLSMVYRLDKNPDILKRIDAELLNACAFEDWNPKHFLDVGEMALGVALAVDWVGDELPQATVALAKNALIEKAILPSYNEGGKPMFWINGTSNWNQVCHGGLVAASLAVAELNPELAAKTLARALENLPNSLHEYAPDGVYPEGPYYWEYGTTYTVIAADLLSSALGGDFGISASPGFMEGANFRLQVTSPTGDFFNFADSSDRPTGSGSLLLAWFAAKTGDALYFNRAFFENPSQTGRFTALGLIWLARYKEGKKSELARAWHGMGPNPVAVFRGAKEEPQSFFLAVKGGCADISHGNMDAGSFVFDLDGVRWSLDPGNQSYFPLEKIGFPLSNRSQDGARWSLLTKGNQGHSNLSVNDARFFVKGYAPIRNFKTGAQPEVSIDMSEIYTGLLAACSRRFVKESERSMRVEDRFETNEATRHLTWAMMTTAEVVPSENGAVLRQDGKEIKLSILEPAGLSVSVLPLDPPPMAIDKTIKNLKRIEIRLAAHLVKDGKATIAVRLSE